MPDRAKTVPPGPWVSPARPLSPLNAISASPKVATGPEGTTVVYWRFTPGADSILQARVRPPAGEFGPIESLSPAGSDASQPVLAVGPDGTIRAVWASFDGVNTTLVTRARSSGGALEPIQNLNTPGPGIGPPALSIGSDGTTTVTWNGTNGTHSIVRARTAPPGRAFGPEVLLSQPGEHSGASQVVTAPDGTTTAVWRRNNGSDHKVQVSTRPPGGSFGPVEDLTSIGASTSQPAVAIGPDGTVAVGWHRRFGVDFFPQVRTRPPGGGFGQTQSLSTPGQPASDPRLAVGPDGTVTAVWSRSDGPYDIAETRSQPPGGQFGPTIDLSQSGASAEQPVISAGLDGSEVVVWSRFDGVADRVESRTRLPGGAFGPTQIISPEGQPSSFSEVAVGPDGRATAVWRRSNPFLIYSISTLAPEYTLAVFVPNGSRGTVTSNPSGIDCGSLCLADYGSFTRVTLTATPATGYRFSGWNGSCSGTEPGCEVTMDEAKSVSADFEADPAACPPKKLKTNRLKRNRKRGTASLKVQTGGKGKVIVKGSKKVKKSSGKVGANGRGRLKVKARGKAAKVLMKKGKVKVTIRLAYRPGGDCPDRTVSRKVKLVRR